MTGQSCAKLLNILLIIIIIQTEIAWLKIAQVRPVNWPRIDLFWLSDSAVSTYFVIRQSLE